MIGVGRAGTRARWAAPSKPTQPYRCLIRQACLYQWHGIPPPPPLSLSLHPRNLTGTPFIKHAYANGQACIHKPNTAEQPYGCPNRQACLQKLAWHPLSSKLGTDKTVKARCWLWLAPFFRHNFQKTVLSRVVPLRSEAVFISYLMKSCTRIKK